MDIRRDDLEAAAHRGILTPDQAIRLWETLERRPSAPPPDADPRPRRLTGIAALAGAAVAVAAAAGLVLVARDRWDAVGELAAATAAGVALVAAARWLERRGLGSASGVLAGAAAAIAGVAAHALQHAFGLGRPGPPADLGDWVVGHEVAPLATAAVACAWALRAFGAPALAAELVGIAWIAAMSAAPAIFGPAPTWSQRALLSVLVGLLALGAAFAVDGRTRRDHASSLYLAGVVALWGSLTTCRATTDVSLVLYAAVNVWLVAAGLLLRRRVLAAFGVIGLAGAAGHVAREELIAAALPFALAAIGVALVAGALGYLRFESRAQRALAARLPAPLRRLLPPGSAR